MEHVKGKRIAVLAEKLYEDLELWYPVLRFREAGAKVMIVGPKAGETYPSKHGYPAKADSSAGDVRAADLDGIVIPGGYSPDHIRRHKAMIELVTDAMKLGKVVGSICHGPWVLCSTHALKGRKLTGFYSIRDDVENAGGLWEDAACVRDGNLVTSRTPDDLPAFMLGLFEALGEVAKPRS
ncbi:type 1 glutamine amidotransferase domain-containing protein [Tundrisphaera lichenicola]|uniref:type 1 glutamine amidotransferase domain-containing protein n=1 Tax=Tundrisphaera lichenicola TaxID=2029860 RepID=UPI003EBDB408